jgi:SAM-dependent methyltransferase
MNDEQLQKAALRGAPSYVWRAGQQRRLAMIQTAAGERAKGRILVDGCGVGAYLAHLAVDARQTIGLDIELERAQESHTRTEQVICAAGEYLPFPSNYFDLVLSHEVLEHVQNDRHAIGEIVRVLAPGGRLALFCPNRGYPFETHGVYWRGRYHFGNIPLVNYLPRRYRDRLAPHVKVYSPRDLEVLFTGLPVKFIERTVVFGAYDNIIARSRMAGHAIRDLTQWLEKTPMRVLGLSHFWVVEKTKEL